MKPACVIPEDRPSSSPPRPRLTYLEGLRGATALYVVLFHIYQIADNGISGDGLLSRLPSSWNAALSWLQFGRSSVAIFIVISGYCLMLPVARSPSWELKGGMVNFFRRRARRILPPYYAALALTVLLFCISTTPKHTFTKEAVLTHVFLIHNLFFKYIYTLNTPMWSVATECQIYLLFPTLLLPIWRSFGAACTLIIASVMGLIPHFLWYERIDHASPWYLGIFAFGMLAAAINFSDRPVYRVLRRSIAWGPAAAMSAGLFFALAYGLIPPGPRPSTTYEMDFLVGLAAACFLISCTRSEMSETSTGRSVFVRLFCSPFMVALGTFSYSLYLTHFPFLVACARLFGRFKLDPRTDVVGMFVCGLPISLIVGFCFFRTIERYFIAEHRPKSPIDVPEPTASGVAT